MADPVASAASGRGHNVRWVLAGLVAVVMLAMLGAQLVLLQAQLRHVRSQDMVARTLLHAARPALGPLPKALAALEPTLRAVSRSDPAATARLGRELARGAVPLVSNLNSANLPYLLNQLTELAVGANSGGRLKTALTEAARLALAVQRADLVHRGASAAAEASRDLPLLLEAILRTERIQNRTLAVQQQSLRAQRQSLSAQRQSLAVQRETLVLIRESLGVQQATLRHAESLDRKVP